MFIVGALQNLMGEETAGKIMAPSVATVQMQDLRGGQSQLYNLILSCDHHIRPVDIFLTNQQYDIDKAKNRLLGVMVNIANRFRFEKYQCFDID